MAYLLRSLKLDLNMCKIILMTYNSPDMLIIVWIQVNCSRQRGRKHTEESWKCDGKNGVDICKKTVTDCSRGDNWGKETAGTEKYFRSTGSATLTGSGPGWDCRWHSRRFTWLDRDMDTHMQYACILGRHMDSVNRLLKNIYIQAQVSRLQFCLQWKSESHQLWKKIILKIS